MSYERVKNLLVETPQGVSGLISKEARFAFNYKTTNRDAEASLTLPIRAESYSSGSLFSIFQMNKPEGYLLEYLKERFSKSLYLDDMMLLKLTGSNQIGRLSYSDPEDTHRNNAQAQVSIGDILTASASEDIFKFLIDTYFDSGISGFQPKVIVPMIEKGTVSTSEFIVKASGEDYPFLSQNEFCCMEVARRAGIEISEFLLSNNGELFIMKRFDRGPEGTRYGLEDMAVLSGRSTEEKYQGSYEGIVRIIDLFCKSNASESKLRFFEYIALSILLKNGDAHLKNFSLIYDKPGGDVRLSPLYDVVTTSIYEIVNPKTGATKVDNTMALNMFKQRSYPNQDKLIEFGKSICAVPNPKAVIERIQEAKLSVLKEYSDNMEKWLMTSLKKAWQI